MRAVDIVCPKCDMRRGERCNENGIGVDVCQARINLAVKLTKDAKRPSKSLTKRKRPVGDVAVPYNPCTHKRPVKNVAVPYNPRTRMMALTQAQAADYKRRKWVEGAKAAAAIAHDYDGTSSHPHRLDDCILGKLNIRKEEPRLNKVQQRQDRTGSPDPWLRGYVTALAEFHRLLLGGNDSLAVRQMARAAGITLAKCRAAGVMPLDIRELKDDASSGWIRGYAMALAEVQRLGDHASIVCEAARNAGLTITTCREAGVESFDWIELQKAGVPHHLTELCT
jgi:hypothetical protein